MNQLLLDVKKGVEDQLYRHLVELGEDAQHLSMLAKNSFPEHERSRKAA
ncbi:hypothetical protein [Halomonas sp. DWK9]|nr:hypothetical protein [Halomonas sp. DWK9]